MIRAPGQPKKHYGIGAVSYHSSETVVLFRQRKRRREIAELLQALLTYEISPLFFDLICPRAIDDVHRL